MSLVCVAATIRAREDFHLLSIAATIRPLKDFPLCHLHRNYSSKNMAGNNDASVAANKNVLREEANEDDDVKVVAAPPSKKAKKQPKLKEPKTEDDDNKRNWLDSEVETLIQLRGEMQPEFQKNAKKQGVNMWLKLHSGLLCLIPNFKKTQKACKNKFLDVLKTYKEDKQANSISGESRHTCKFYDAMDTWYHHNGAVVKHISASIDDTGKSHATGEEDKEENEESMPTSTTTETKLPTKMKFQEKSLNLISQLVDNSKNMAHSMEVANGFMGNLDRHMEKLIEKL
ncbi:hypothetical protein KC19_VG107200 [Ceratodon purpureus]|uniref:Myb/SANT-like DNA-binding domain-containing protein n=1 Tax=Ceratodon purpureus TaxID=3225 RepID=A0A8T0HNT1_CERPU|nr:hypothetical protein KC19_VG107200 [Ceratodon purpureus]